MTIHVPEAKLTRVKGILKTFLAKPLGKVREVASVIGKLIALEPALGRLILVGTRLATIEIVITTDGVDSTTAMRRNPWNKRLTLDEEALDALRDVVMLIDGWNGAPTQTPYTGITLSSILPMEATALLDRKIPARRVEERRAVMASDASDFAVASYSVEGMPDFSFSDELKEEEKKMSSSHRELLAIRRTLKDMLVTGELRPGAPKILLVAYQ
jgi:hypothetical protein